MFKKVYKVYSVLSGVDLSISEVSILAYYNVFGASEKTDNFLFKTGVFRNRNTFNNCKAKLRRHGFMEKPRYKNDIAQHLKFPVEPSMGMLIKFDNG